MVQTYDHVFQEGLTRGLRPNKELTRGAEALTVAENWRVTQHGLAEHIPILQYLPSVVINGTFTGDASGWTITADWAYGVNNIVYTNTGGAPENICQHICATMNRLYLVTYTVSAYNSPGTVLTYEARIGGNSGGLHDGNGTHSEYIVAGGDAGAFAEDWLYINVATGNGGDTITVDDISAVPVSVSSDLVTNGDFALTTNWEVGTGWAIAGGVAAHTAGVAPISQIYPNIPLRVGETYQVIWTTANRTVGDITAKLGTGAGTAQDTNATFTEYITCVGTPTLNFVPTNDWDGDIDDVSVRLIQGYIWPFPQIFEGAKEVYYLGNRVAGVADIAAQAMARITTFDARNPAGAKAITAGNPWQFGEFFGVWFATNGQCLIYDIPSTSSDKVVVEDTILFNSVCVNRDRLFFGGFTDTGAIFTSQRWLDLWEQWLSYTDDEQFTYTGQVIGTNWVMWSRPFGGEYYTPFGTEMAMFQIPSAAVFDNVKVDIYTDLETREIGFAEMPWSGTVLRMEALGEGIIVYGDEGIAALVPADRGFVVQHLSKIGLYARGAVAGDSSTQLFIDKKGNFWLVDANFTLTRLDYKEFGSTLLHADMVLSFNPQRNEFYACKDELGYTLTQDGLSQITQIPTSLILYDDDLVGVTNMAGSSANAKLTTNILDFGIRDYKTIQSIEVAASDMTNVYVRVYGRVSGSDAWTAWDDKLCNAEGVAVVIASAVEFKVEVYGLQGTDAIADYVNIRWKALGKRYPRSMY